MPRRFAGRTGRIDARYRIVIRGEIGEPLVGPLEGMSVEIAGDESVLTGDLVDQAQLQGALRWLNPTSPPGRWRGARRWRCSGRGRSGPDQEVEDPHLGEPVLPARKLSLDLVQD